MNPSLNSVDPAIVPVCDRCKLLGLALNLAAVDDNDDPEEMGYFVAPFLHHAQQFMKTDAYSDLNRRMDHQLAPIYAGGLNELD
jgi:hypothetical protein